MSDSNVINAMKKIKYGNETQSLRDRGGGSLRLLWEVTPEGKTER